MPTNPVITVKLPEDTPKDLIPAYESDAAAGVDLRAAHDGVLEPGAFGLVKTGLFMEIPAGYEGQVRPRSGLALKKGVTVLNTPGTVDADYRGEVGVILINHSKEPFEYHRGDRIAQMVFAKVEHVRFTMVPELSGTNRGEGGFGSSGVK